MVAEQGTTDVDLRQVARSYLDRWFPQRVAGTATVDPVAALAGVRPRWDDEYCRRVADFFERAPRLDFGARLRQRYDRFKQENLQQYQAIADAGITVLPWLSAGQPYTGSTQLRRSVRATGVLHVYLTAAGHGPGPDEEFHPMREPSGIESGGIAFSHNDLFRAVHDVFGHVMPGNNFSPRGEFRASFCHMRMYSDEVHPVLFTEQIGQVCWFFYRPQQTAGSQQRPYPAQKVFEFPPRFLDEFFALFPQYREAR